MMRMDALYRSILLWHYFHGIKRYPWEDLEEEEAAAEALVDLGFFEDRKGGPLLNCYVLTEKARVLCHALDSVPDPIQKWIMPGEDEI